VNQANERNDRRASDRSLDDQLGELITADGPDRPSADAAPAAPEPGHDDPEALIASADSFASPEEAEAIEEDLAKQIQELLDHGDEAAFDDVDTAADAPPPAVTAQADADEADTAGNDWAEARGTDDVSIDEIDAMLADEAEAFDGRFETVDSAVAADTGGADDGDDTEAATHVAANDADDPADEEASDEPAPAGATAADVAAELDFEDIPDAGVSGDRPADEPGHVAAEIDDAPAATPPTASAQASHALNTTVKAAKVTAGMAERALRGGCAAVNTPLSYFSDTTRATVGYVGLQVLFSGIVLITYALLR